MLGWRLTVSAVLIPALFGLFFLDHRAGARAPILLGLCLLLAARAAWELATLLRTRAMQPGCFLPALACCAVVAAGWYGHASSDTPAEPMAVGSLGAILLAYTFSVLLLMLFRAMCYREPGQNMETLASELLIVSYVGVLLSITVQLRWVAGAEAGYLVIGSLVIAAKFGDVGAYTLGRLFGRKKMCPCLSPGKTWMGGLGALLGAGLAAVAWLTVAPPRFHPDWQPSPWYWALLYGVSIGAAGLVGDLCESLIKRDIEQKDSAQLLPGFGGLLDLLDSVLYAGPVAFLLWQVLPLASWQ